jgi:hypothetical protein
MSMLRLSFSVFLSLSIVLSTVIPSKAQAFTISDHKVELRDPEILNEIFDRFQYSMSVLWDQEDADFKQQMEQDLRDALDTSGVTTSEMIEYISTKILSGNKGKEFKRLMEAMKEQGIAPESAAALAARFMMGAYAEGTHFMGEGGPGGSNWTIVVTVLVVAVVAHWLIKKAGKHHDHDDDGDTIIIIVNQ